MKASWAWTGVGVLLSLVACGGEGSSGSASDSGVGANSQCSQPACFDRCLCEGKAVADCAAECAATPGTGGASSGSGGATSTGNGGVTSGNGGTASGNGGVVGAGGTVSGNGGVVGAGGTVSGNGGVVGAGGTVSGNGGTTSAGGTTGAGGTNPVDISKSITISTDAFDVQPGGEVYVCQDFANLFGKDIDIVYSESFMTAGSHHMFAFRMPGLGDGALGACPNGGVEFHDYVHSAQTPQATNAYPPGVGRFLPGSDGLRIMAHYLNTSDTVLHATIALTLHYVDSNQVQAHAAGIFLNNVGLAVTPGAYSTTRSYTVPYAIKILGGASHMHKHGIHFIATATGNKLVYEGTQWDEPPPNAFDPGLDVAGGDKITWTCDYQNDTQQTYRFGESASTNEMCIYSGVFYPSPDGSSLTPVVF